MLTLYCDESDDGETYALAGWLATPTGGSIRLGARCCRPLPTGEDAHDPADYSPVEFQFGSPISALIRLYLRGITGLRSSCSCPIPPQTISRSLRE